jgi:predicted transcriptional regulator
MNIQFTIKKIYVFPQSGQFTNVIGKLDWEVRVSEGLAESFGVGETLLNTDNITNFVPVEQVTEAQMIEWLKQAEGGEQFLQTLQAIHAPQVAWKARQFGLVPWEAV